MNTSASKTAKAQPPVREEDLDLLPDPDAIEQRPIGGGKRAVLYLMAGFIACALLWASLAEVDETVMARGRLVSTERNLVVQPLETSIVESIHVRVGQVVRKGEVLATLDPTFSEANRATAQGGVQSLEARSRRLEDELGRRTGGEPGTTGRKETVDDQLQAELASARQANYKARLRSLEESIGRIDAAQGTNAQDQRLLAERLKSLEEVEAMQQQLVDMNFGARRSLLEAREKRLEVQRELEQARNRSRELARELAASQSELQAWKNDWRQKTIEELAQVSRERQAASEELSKAQRRRNLITMVAPMDAVVLEIADVSIGTVVREAEQMFKLVPWQHSLEVELQISPQDVGFIAVGQAVKIKLDAFPFQRHGSLQGTLSSVSQDALPRAAAGADRTPAAESYYRAKVRLDSTELRRVPPETRLLPGLTADTQVVVGRRSVLWYFLMPIFGTVDDALRERR
jgi:HlyD family secretion protein